MSDIEINTDNAQVTNDWKTRILAIGVIVGALVGAGTAYLLAQNLEKQGREVKITGGEGVKVALTVLGAIRSITSLTEPK